MQAVNTRDTPRHSSVSHFNDSWKEYALVKPEFVKYKSFDGMEIEGAVLKPANFQAGTKYPMIVLVHGGPTGAWSDSIETWGQLLAAHGFLIFYPNVRGSTGYGHKFIESNRNDWGGGDFKDVMAGVDYMIAQGSADPDRLGIGGWSYGGYMSEWAITQTTRFKAAVSGAGLANLASEFGTENGSSYDEWFFGTPYENLDAFMKSSPSKIFEECKNSHADSARRSGYHRSHRPKRRVVSRTKTLRSGSRDGGLSPRAARPARRKASRGSAESNRGVVRRAFEVEIRIRDARRQGSREKPAWSRSAPGGLPQNRTYI